jgi:hypothetical protein
MASKLRGLTERARFRAKLQNNPAISPEMREFMAQLEDSVDWSSSSSSSSSRSSSSSSSSSSSKAG